MGCCGSSPDWKREEVPDHKFDFIDVREYHTNGWFTRLRYCVLYLLVIKSFAVYIADIYTAITLIALGHFNGTIYDRVQNSPNSATRIPISISRWIFTGCIIFSFLLLAYEAHKARAIMRSRDISYAYTNVMANDYYSLRSYDHFCFFCQINNSKKKKDEFAFFIFFTFKGWKRLLLADGPRQVINALTLYTLAASAKFSTNVNDYYEGNIFTAVMLLTMIFTVVIFAGSAILLLIAALMYVPLLCYIQGNLKEYCCHKIDKRISELVKRKKKQRLAKQAAIARKEAAGDFSHLKNKKGQIVGQAIPQPTLPAVDVDLFSDDKPGAGLKRNPSVGSSTAHGGYGMHGGSTDKLAYESPSFGPTRYGGRPDTDSLYDGSHAADDYSSTAHLVMHPGEAGGYSAPGARESPDAYPVHARGPGEFPAGQHPASPAMLAAMGPIGTSPELFAQRVRGQSPAPSAASAAQQQQQALLDAMGPIGTSPMLMAQQVRSRSPLAPREQYAPSRQQQQQQYAETYANAGVDYPPTPQANGVAGLEFPPPPPPDMSNYVPLSGPGGGEQVSHSQHGHGYSHDAYAASAPSPRSGHPADTSPPVPDHAAYDDIYDAYDAYDAYAGVQEDVRGPDGPQDGIYHEQRTRQGVYGQQDYDYNQYADAWGGNAHQQQHQQQQHGHAHGQAHGHAQGQGQYGYEGYSNAQDAYDKHGGFAR